MTQEELQVFARTLDPSAQIIVKEESWLMKVIAVLVWLFNRDFMTQYATTICNRIYIPRDLFGRDLRSLVVHEVSGHVKQCRWCGLGIHPLVGFPIYAVLYLLLPIPLFLAYLRYRFELAADAKAWKWALENGEPVERVRDDSEDFAKTVASWDYLKPWPKSWVIKGFAKRFEKVLAEVGAARG
jgi:hypothetical protein